MSSQVSYKRRLRYVFICDIWHFIHDKELKSIIHLHEQFIEASECFWKFSRTFKLKNNSDQTLTHQVRWGSGLSKGRQHNHYCYY
jgi:hypothetical protein